jgi:hypothetical protein
MDDFLINPQLPGETKSFSLTGTVSKETKFERQNLKRKTMASNAEISYGWPILVNITIRMFFTARKMFVIKLRSAKEGN